MAADRTHSTVGQDANSSTRSPESEREWEHLRQEIYRVAIHFSGGLRFDFRQLLSDGFNLKCAGRLMWQLIKPYDPQVLVGPGFGAAPLLFATTLAALDDGQKLHTLMIRDQRKAHNRKRWVEGERQADGSRAVVIDDFMEGGSAISLIETALNADNHVLDVVAVAVLFDMWQPLGSRQISIERFPVRSIFKRHDIGLSRDCFDAKPPQMKGRFPPFIDAPRWHRFELNHNKRHSLKSAPVIADGAVFAADDASQLWRHNAANGDVEWCYQSVRRPAKGIVQRLQYADGSLVLGCYDGTVTRVDAADGSVRWRWKQGSSIHATPTLDLENNRIFLNTEQWNEGNPVGHLQALDWTTGRQLWASPQAYWPPGSVAYDPESNGVVGACNDGYMSCFEANLGVLRWRINSNGLVRGKPAIAGGYAYWATESAMLCCVDMQTGATRWETPYGVPGGHQWTLVESDLVYVLDGKWHLLAFDAQTGRLRWLGRLRSQGCTAPVRYGKYLVVLSEGGELAVFDSAQRLKVWEGAIGGTYRQNPALADGILAAASNDTGLKLFDVHPFYSEV